MVTRSNYQKRRLWKYLLSYAGLLAAITVLIWSIHGSEVSISNIIRGIPNVVDFLSHMIPPSGSILSQLGKPLSETFQIAITAIVVSTVIAFPFSFLAARNIMGITVIYQITRAILSILRGIPPLIYALLFVSMVGLGPFAGVLALTCHCVGTLGRYFSEVYENINPEIINAAKAAGANKIKTIIHAVIPEVSALLLGYILYYFEYNVRTSTVLGLVGAGGIGLQLMISIHLFKYDEVATIMLITIAIIIVMDRIATMMRMRIIKGRMLV